jgi:hypothetical protein
MGGDGAGDVGGERTWDRPAGASRVPAYFDFEGRITSEGIILPFPPGWVSGNPAPPNEARQGFPFWNEPGYSTRHAASGEHSFVLPTKGGSTAAHTEPGAFPAMPGSEYVVSAKLRTAGLTHAKVRLVARYLRIDRDERRGGGVDAGGTGVASGERAPYRVVPGSERSTAPTTSEGRWTALRLDMPGDARADFIQLELQLLQPSELLEGPRAPHQALRQDVSGAAWFDDVAVYQVPKLSIETNAATNMIEAPMPVELRLNVRDLTGEPLTARVWVWDMNGSLVDAATIRSAHAAGATTWRPELPAYGWYRATIGVRNASQIVGVGSVDFVYLSPRANRSSWNAPHFGVIAERLRAAELRTLPGVVDTLGVGAVALSAWGHISASGNILDDPVIATAPGGADDRANAVADDSTTRLIAFDEAVDDLLSQRRELTFVLGAAPERLARAARVELSDPLAMLSAEREAWLGSLDGLLTRYGERVHRWQIGAAGSHDTFGREGLHETLRRVRRAMQRLIPGVEVIVPWDAEQSLASLADGDGASEVGGVTASLEEPTPSGVIMRFAGSMPALSIPHYVATWPARYDVTLFLETPDESVFGRRAAAIDLAKRTVLAWEAGVEHLSIRTPWSWRGRDGGGELRPTVHAAVWRELAAALDRASPGGRLPTSDGATLILGDAGSRGVLVAWADYATGDDATLRAYLGDGRVTVRDIFGNVSPARVEDGRHIVELSEMPVFIEGVNPDLLRFWASLRFEPATIPAEAKRHDLELVVENPWPVSIAATIRFAEPESWGFTPRVLNVSLRSGEATRIPVSVTLNVGEESGERTVDTELMIKADRDRFGPLRVPMMTSLGLKDVEMSGSYRIVRGPGGERDRVVVVVLATNHGDHARSLEAFVQAPGFPSEQAPIIAIEPGDSRSATFYFDDPDRTLLGTPIRVGVKEYRGAGRLNKTIMITGK